MFCNFLRVDGKEHISIHEEISFVVMARSGIKSNRCAAIRNNCETFHTNCVVRPRSCANLGKNLPGLRNLLLTFAYFMRKK